MIINIKVVPNSKEDKIILENNIYKVKLKAKPIENKANLYLIELLADYFNTKKSNIKIKKGLTSRNKLIEII